MKRFKLKKDYHKVLFKEEVKSKEMTAHEWNIIGIHEGALEEVVPSPVFLEFVSGAGDGYIKKSNGVDFTKEEINVLETALNNMER